MTIRNRDEDQQVARPERTAFAVRRNAKAFRSWLAGETRFVNDLMDFQKDYDVVVAGAGIAGVAASIEIARSGMKAALVEKTVLVGGLATTGIVNIYLPICDGCGKQVTFGLAEELLHLCNKYGPGDVPPNWEEIDGGRAKARYRLTFSPAAYILALDEALAAAGVDLWLDTVVCTPIMKRDRVAGVEVENKSGRGALHAKCVIDATGDADVAHRAGAECALGENWVTIWALEASLDAAKTAVEENNGDYLLSRATLGGDNAGRGKPDGSRMYTGVNGKDVSEFIVASRKLLRERYQAAQAENPQTARHNLWALTLPSMAQFRTTRRIVGHTTMVDGQHGIHVDDSVGLVADWRKPGHVWEVPYGALLPQTVKGLLAAGRCMDSDADAWEVMRVIPAAALTGQVAGIAATLSVRHNATPDALAAADVQQELRDKGIPLHLGDVGL